MNGIIIVNDPSLIASIEKNFPGWLVLASNSKNTIEFHPVPPTV